MTNKKFVNTKNVENHPDTNYNSVISTIQKEGVCPFCPDQLKKYHKNPIIEETENWLVTNNMYPYKNSKHHILLIHKKHIESLTEMTEGAWLELRKIAVKAIDRSKIPGGTFFIRFGDTRYTGASVSHLHGHLVSSNPDSPEYGPLLTRIG